MANGNFAGGTGVLDDPFLIEDAFDLDAVRNDLSGHYKLINDIDLDISPFNEDEGWVPIGDNSTSNNSTRFRGVLDGDGYVIKNLYVNRPDKDFQALFGYNNGATISNVGVEDVDVTGGDYTGGLVGRNANFSTIKNSYSTGSVTGGDYTGGLVGVNNNSSTISNSYSTGSVNGSGIYTGGLVGDNYSSSVITNSYSTGNVNGGDYTGGLVGYNNNSSVTNSYSTGSVNGADYTGGLVGDNYRSSVTNSFWDTETSGMTTSAGGTGLTTQEMQTAQTFIDAGWDLETLEDGTAIWILKDGVYPELWFNVTKKHLVKDGNKIITIKDNTLVEIGSGTPTPQLFKEQGFDDISLLDTSVLSKLTNTPELLFWYDINDETPIILVEYNSPQWQTVSTTIPSVDTFKEEGMNNEDLSALDRKPTDFTQTMSEVGALGGGCKFSTTIDLKKYFDITEIRVK